MLGVWSWALRRKRLAWCEWGNDDVVVAKMLSRSESILLDGSCDMG